MKYLIAYSRSLCHVHLFGRYVLPFSDPLDPLNRGAEEFVDGVGRIRYAFVLIHFLTNILE